ncbi:DUF427 domain-containing protein [Microbaculum marinum]|uniref:DUF427 domain-containing protein n=1 Tax=Microbaculum marinum TaxID=1764581 RepID=A0AAW9RQY1_9HYPH
MKLPGPDHPITIEPVAGVVRVKVGDDVIVSTTHALMMRESSYPPVYYFPREDADMRLLEPTGHTTHCPYKGDANYYSIPALGQAGDNAVWSYETPFSAVADIVGHLAFYPDRVTIEAG